MAASEVITAAIAGQKRGPGRPPKNSLLPNKKTRRENLLDNIASLSPSRHSTPNSETAQRGLPVRLHETRPLPTLPQPQSLNLPDTDYASIASSGVLAKSLEQSRVSWTQHGVFDRFWTKPETGKHAKPPPANNPDLKSMKNRGRCRLRIEPHIFEVEVYVVEKPRSQQPKQYMPPKHQAPQWQVQQPHAHTPVAPAPPAADDKKAAPDPVIGLLAARAGNDPELKALMREVAAGNAQPEQLKVFQKHIDELNSQLHAQRANQPKPASSAAVPQQFPQQQYVAPVPPVPSEVVFAFTTHGSTNDRFLFPQHCILESLTPQHLLASFVVTRKGSAATNTADIDVDKEYWSPVTIMVEVAYGREGILKDIQRWVKPVEESQAYMTKIMSELERVPETHLALRLPLKGSIAAESGNTSKVSTPAPQVTDSTVRKKPAKESTPKEPASSNKRGSMGKRSSLANAVAATVPETSSQAAAESKAMSNEQVAAEVATPGAPNDGNGRPTRSTRRSTRYSDV